MAIAPRFGRIAWQAAQDCGMGSPERCRLLFVIGDSKVRAGLVAQHLKLSAPAVTELVEALVGEGLIRRETDPDDRRAVVLALTPEGRRQRERYEHAAATALARVVSRLSITQRRRLRAAFADLRAAFTEAEPATAPILHRSFTAASRPRRSVRRITDRENANAR
ncbi:MAG TPA: MarR family transcriptional regulator [Candidatus Limnocylindria bacterium]|nr:MarR family transcriptional regulator [Candidatus Limnocylindria bacterium]